MRSLLLILACSMTLCLAQDLPRYGSLGVSAVPVTDSVAASKGMPFAKGILVTNVLPDLTAAAAGIMKGDVLLEINGKKIESPSSLASLGRGFRHGTPVTFAVWSGGKQSSREGKVVGKPLETTVRTKTVYDVVPFRGGKLRAIISRPDSGEKFPAVFFIQGYTCATIDNLNPIHPYRRIFDSLTQCGYAVMRVEKPGIGDCETAEDCAAIDIHTETAAFEAALRQMKTYSFVDTANCFIFGHSMGGIIAPLIAATNPLKGVMVYGTDHLPWFEYLLRMLRFQNPGFGISYAETENDMRVYHRLLYAMFIERKTVAELRINPEYEKLLIRDMQLTPDGRLFGRSLEYQQSLMDLNLTDSWLRCNAAVLAVFGEGDYEVMDDFGQKTIVDIVNSVRPGTATFRMLTGTNHSMLLTGNMKESFAVFNSGLTAKYMAEKFNYGIIHELDTWMKGIMGK